MPVNPCLDFSAALPETNAAPFTPGYFFPKHTLKYEFSNCEDHHLFSHKAWGRTREGVCFLVMLPTCDFWLCIQAVEWKAFLSSWLQSAAQDSLPDFSGWFKSALTLAYSLLCKWKGKAMCTGDFISYQNSGVRCWGKVMKERCSEHCCTNSGK